ncbi:hypothetical protein M2322_003553 [Rhodoblastus acidophilus]|uniref:GDSL-type esterase/lipase family protein n=1 Tax=Rhodoblastus acidophilus TaxID=1074 RepID=UPI002224E766|nr:GDSL-type esterase/lipase family protein [Rhodoblastus acidophilus]MCW2317988.1 hypothetical protein [Rhodoblastus acidophilus]
MISRRNFLKACAAAASAATLSSALAGGPPAIPPPAPATSATIRSLGARNNLIATVGDSLTAHGVGWSNATITVKRSRGWQTWAAQASGQRVVFRPDLNFALAGRTTTDIIYTAEPSLGGKTQLQCAIDSPADTVHVMAGTNDFNLSVLNSITLANYALILRALLAAGKRVIWAVSPPSGSPAFPSARRPTANATSAMIARRWIMDLTGMPNVFPYDTWPLMEDQSAAGVAGDYIGEQTVDGTHYTTRGGYTHGALCLAPLLMQIFPSVSILPASEIDAFNATSNPGGNLIGNPYMCGTTGTMATSATGVVATGATLDAAVRAQNPDTLTDLERAARFLYLQKLSFGGKVAGRTFGIQTGGPARFDALKLGVALEAIHARLAGVMIECLDWKPFLNRWDRAGTLFFLDPPYAGTEDYYGPGLFGPEQHELMADSLSRLKGHFILTINDTPATRQIYQRFEIEAAELTYSAAGADKRRPAREIIVSG